MEIRQVKRKLKSRIEKSKLWMYLLSTAPIISELLNFTYAKHLAYFVLCILLINISNKK